jgi:TusA-related sulfurtransferase
MQKKTLISLLTLGLLATGASSAFAAEDAATQDQFAIERSVENIENGVIITLTSDDPEVVEKLQNPPEHPPQMEGAPEINHELELLDNGVRITITSEDPEVVAKIQEQPFGKGPGKGPHGPMNGPMMENVDRTVENIDNGVVITLTSDDPELVKMLQDHAEGGFGPKAPEQEELDE